jgi:hypothetical protein
MKWSSTMKIDAPAALVWRLTTEVENWPDLTRTMSQVTLLDPGPFGLGSRARVKQPAQRSATWTVTQFEPNRSFSWQTSRRGLSLTGTHDVERDDAGCLNTLHLEATGTLTPLFALLLGPAIRWSLRLENAGFKGRAEELAEASPTTGDSA